jgi:hypothetical protein
MASSYAVKYQEQTGLNKKISFPDIYTSNNKNKELYFWLTVLWYSCMASSHAVKYKEQTGLIQ